MGKGDKKTKRGKIARGSYGVRRPRKSNKPAVIVAKPKKKAATKPKAVAKPKTVAKPKAVAKPKTAAKKTATKKPTKKE